MKTQAEQLQLAKAAIQHVLNAIADDPRKYWLMGELTGSWEKLTTAAAAIWNKPIDEIKESFRPEKDKYQLYCARVEALDRMPDILKEALAQTGCDGDLCLYRWHEKARQELNKMEGRP